MRVVIVEDSVLLQEGIVRLLAGYGHETVAEARRCRGRRSKRSRSTTPTS